VATIGWLALMFALALCSVAFGWTVGPAILVLL
jgi:hypothetical protein